MLPNLLKKTIRLFTSGFLLMLLLNTHVFAQDGLVSDDFSTGNTYNWVAGTSGATSTLTNGQLVIKMALQTSGKYRGDFKKNGGVTFHAGQYPIVAIRFNKPPKCNLFFDTNLGSYNNTNNNGTKIAMDSGNIYYWDLSTGKLGTTTLSTTAPTTLSTFQFKVADVELTQAELAANDISFEINWVRTFRTVNELRLFAGLTAPPAYQFAGTFSHPGLLHNATDLARIKDFVTRKFGRPYESYKLLLTNNKASASYSKGGPFTYLTRDPSITVDGIAGGTVKDRVESDFMAAYYNALMWTMTGNTANAQKAVEIIDAYSAKTIGIIGSDAELNGLYGFMLANAAEIMRYTYSSWPQANIQKCQTMLQSVFYPTLQNFRPCAHGNWDIICMKALMSIAIFSEDYTMFNKVVNYFYYGEGNGSIDNYVLTDAGQLQESNRDQPHTMLAIGSLAEVSEMGLKQGIDLYKTSDNAIMRGFEYTSKYNLGYTVPFQTSYEFCEKNYQDYTPEAISANGRGQFRAVFEIAFNHYVYRKGLQMPYTLQVMAAMGPEGAPFGADNPGYGSLLFYLSDSVDHRFDTTGNYLKGLINDNFTNATDGWSAVTTGASAASQNGQLVVNTAVQTNGTKRGDIRKSGTVGLLPANYPIIAIKMKKPVTCNFTFDTNLGSYGNGSNKFTGKVGDDIYYYDLTKTGFGSANTLISNYFLTALTIFQFKVADISSGETSYTVDWIKSVKSVNDLLAYDSTTGLINDNFITSADGWAAATTSSTAIVESEQLKVTPALQSNGKYRGDIRKTAGDTLYAGNYPIVAIKFKKPQVSNITFDTNLGSYGNGSNKFTGKVGADVYYYDLTKTGFGSAGTMLTSPTPLSIFQFKIADISSGETSYAIDWIKTVKTVQDLEKLVPHVAQTISFDSIPNKLVDDADFELGATASSGLAVLYTISDTSVATFVNGKVHIVKAGTVTITATQAGDSVFMPADSVSQQLTVNRIFYVDGDGDGYGAGAAILLAVNETPNGYVTNNTDCDDTKLLYADNDGDGLGAGNSVACGVANNNDCDDTNPVQLTVTIPNVYAMNPAVDLKNTIYVGYGPSSLTIAAQAAGGTAAYTYNWSPSQTSQTIQVSSAGTYMVTITDAKGCQATASIHVDTVNVQCGNSGDKVMICHNGCNICVASAAVQAHLNHGDKLGSCGLSGRADTNVAQAGEVITNVVAYPNPVSGNHFNIKTPAYLVNQELVVGITDMWGKLVFKKLVSNKSGNIEVQLDKKLKNGIYLVKMNEVYVTKIIILQ